MGLLAQLIPEFELNTNIGIEPIENSMVMFMNAGIEKGAVVVGVAVGGWFAFKIVRKGLAWASRAF